MNSMTISSEFPPEAEYSARNQTTEDATSSFSRRILRNEKQPRRYLIVFLLFIFLMIDISRYLRATDSLVNLIVSEILKDVIPSNGTFTVNEPSHLRTFMQVGGILGNILGALFIYQYSSHIFLGFSVAASSALHMLVSAAAFFNSLFVLKYDLDTFFLVVKIGHEILSIPVYTAILSIWKDWAPPVERTRLVTISFCGILLEAISVILCVIVLMYISESFLYLMFYRGIAGMIWVYLWCSTMSDTPVNDPMISEKEFRYLESTILSNYQEKVKLKDVPWKSIAKSKQVIILCLIFFKISISFQTIQIAGLLFILKLSDTYNTSYIFIPFMTALVFILIGTSFLMDILLQKYKDKTLTIRRTFLCTGFGLQSVFLLGIIISHSELVKVIFYVLAYSFLALSIPGALTYPLDLSPRYVSILAGIGFAFFSLGPLSIRYIFEPLYYWKNNFEFWLFLSDGIITLCIAIIFGVWGDAKEQPWSSLTSSHRRSNDQRSYPQPDDGDELNLLS